MELDTYIGRFDTFISHLPESEMKILIFVAIEQEYIPYINRRAIQWSINSDPLYILPKAKGYWNIYLDSTMTHHLTIGLSESKLNGNILLETRLTIYFPDTNHPTTSYRDSLECNVFLTDTLDKTTDCIQMGKARGQTLGIYDDEDKRIFPILQSIHHIFWNGMVCDHGSLNPHTCGFNDSYVERVKEMLLDEENLEQATVIDDGSDDWMVRYILREHGNDIYSAYQMKRL
jgi:hypothetical protein